jgi:hypothetical protein
MTLYARINPDTGLPEWRDLAAAPTGKRWVPLIVDAQPAPSATQVVIDAGLVIGQTEAHQTYALRDKTADELEAEALQTERAQITTYIADIQAQLDISNATRGAMTTNQRLNTLEADTRSTMRAVKYLLRQAKRQ